MTKYFGTDGVRGQANTELSPELAFKLGRYGGHVLTSHIESGTPLVIVGRDTRISGKMLEYALIAGLLSVGVEVMRVGVIPTPGLAYLTRVQKATAGVMISASHNPAEDNGIKFFGSDGFKLTDEEEAEIEALLHADEDNLPRPSAEGLKNSVEFKEGTLKYIQFLTNTIDEDLSGLKIVLDGAHGATAPFISRLFADLNADFSTIGNSPDGLNINVNVGSTHPEALAEKVLEEEADLGLAFDGDGDRVIAVDEKGRIIDGDRIMFIIGKYLNEKERLAQKTIVSTVMSNIGFYKAVEEAGMSSTKTKVGDRYVVEEMREHGYNFGGEQSGHIVLLDYATTGDGMLTGIQLANVVKSTGKSLSELADQVNIYPQKLENIKVSNQDKHTAMENPAIKAAIDQVENDLAGNGRVLVRPSGTEPLLRVMVEGPSEELVEKYTKQISDVVREEIGIE